MSLSNNDTFRRLRYALNLNDARMVQIFALAALPLERIDIEPLLQKETDADFVECQDYVLAAFLDGLILQLRGRKEGSPEPSTPQPGLRLTNNDILKKLRIALELREDDLIAIMKRANVDASASELGALFRQSNHRNFKPCGDQFLRNFITGLEGYKKI